MNTSDLLEQLLRAGQGSMAQKGAVARRPKAGSATWVDCSAACWVVVLVQAVAVVALGWAICSVACSVVVRRWAVHRKVAPLAALIMRRWRPWA